jgi:SnoaL-like protein
MEKLRMINPDVVRECFEGYLTHDRDAAEALIADDFVFTSPQDDHIDRAAFFEHCFPTAGRVRTQELLHVISSDGDDVFVLYSFSQSQRKYRYSLRPRQRTLSAKERGHRRPPRGALKSRRVRSSGVDQWRPCSGKPRLARMYADAHPLTLA